MTAFGKGARCAKRRSAGIPARETRSLAIRRIGVLEELARNWDPRAVYRLVKVVIAH